ncbi:MAG: hypothetical protein H0X39_00435 [Actinobacteria bacterium]|nr:hypothetical protein [Actinomycetota bacterium]
MSFLDYLALNRIFGNAGELITRKKVLFTGAVDLSDDPANLQSVVRVLGPGLTASLTLLAGTNNDQAPDLDLYKCGALQVNALSACNLAGLVPPSVTTSTYHLTMLNLSAFTITVKHLATTSLVANRLNSFTAADISWLAGKQIYLIYKPSDGWHVYS